jgi:two-component system CheB/CheR fusion protein
MTNQSKLDPGFEALLVYLRETRGFDFSAYKRSTLMRRVNKRMHAAGTETFADYQDYLEVHPEEFALLFDTILINVTAFFRDLPAWDYLSKEVIPVILARKDPGATIRVWSAGCSSGEESYTIAILLAEALGADQFRDRVKIYATDIDEAALNTARHAIYSTRQVASVPEELRQKYFEMNAEVHGFRKDLRRAVIFGRHDLLQDAPISRVDLLISRNTLMYFNSDAQARIMARFHYALNEGGFLFLGKAETLLSHTQRFEPVDLRYRIFSKPLNAQELPDLRELTAPPAALPLPPTAGDLIRASAFEEDQNAHFVLDEDLRLILANRRARDMFGLQDRDIGRPFQDLEVSYRPLELRSSIAQMRSENREVRLQEFQFGRDLDSNRWFEVYLTPLFDGARQIGTKISFIDVTTIRHMAEELEQSKGDLETAYEELQSSNEELETTNEELQSTVEELETTNEELQSTNEELETMNEELQSTNEELEAVNEELRLRGTDLNNANSFLESILTSLRAGVAVIDASLIVRAWNRQSEELWGVRTDEALGTHILNLDIGLRMEELLQPIRDVLAGRTENYETVLDATNRRGRQIRCRISITSQRLGQIVGGAVILMDTPEGDSMA